MKKFVFLSILVFMACNHQKPADVKIEAAVQPFDTSLLQVKSDCQGKVRGQVLYVPVYSNLPNMEASAKQSPTHDLSAVLAIHNTDLKNPVKITQVLYFNTNGQLVKNFLTKEMILNPLAATSFYISTADTSGAGANFIVEWVSMSAVCEPLVETIMMDMKSFQGTSFLSRGKVIREVR